jgi:hypothetical protein
VTGDRLTIALENVAAAALAPASRVERAETVAAAIREAGRYTSVAVYETDAAGSRALASAGARAAGPELTVPVHDARHGGVRGTIAAGAQRFTDADHDLLESCAAVAALLWEAA